MKRTIHYNLLAMLGVASLLTACDERVIARSETQYFTVTDFANTIVSTLSPVDQRPNKLTIQIRGSLTKPVIMTVLKGGNPAAQKIYRRDSIAAGSSVSLSINEDYYENDTLQLRLTGSKSTTGSLTVEWSRN
ncbi:hypothetical protein [Arsenicibacter rosenii]|uniref:Uncharacterized protein n=1 Tax=Arsenicibacter rosenii TaxID=1750698 RepID=A0A1S2V9X7_9BACT|nr:hypothetical protein [Arsenicibacter rosenii]OIN55513.1 hypothetical protein BLX24_29870 [Arsenicibacter rosenii]